MDKLLIDQQVNNGERTEEAFEAIECPEALDAVQDGRDMGEKHFETCMMCERSNNADHPFFLGASPFPRSAQVKRVSTFDTDPQK